jgi:putative N6-adenine-specific DNA methylase
MSKEYFATVARGLEVLAAEELATLGAINPEPVFTGVKFSGDKYLLYRVNLWSRLIYRVLVPIAQIKSRSAEELYKNTQTLEWRSYLTPEQTLAVHCTGGNENLNHTHYSALGIKNAITDQQQQQMGLRSSVDTDRPDISINAHIEGDNCLFSLDSSGGSLHRRGYHPAMGIAPLKETLAAALLDMAKWRGDLPLLDPCCGSGTIAIEAALKALDIAPGLYRSHFGFQKWPDYEPWLWQTLLSQAQQRQKAYLDFPIFAADAQGAMVEQAKSNAAFCDLEERIQFSQVQIADLEAPSDRGVIICNPPYGKRLGNPQELGSLYKLLGDVFKQRFKGWVAYVLTGNKELAKQVGLRCSQRLTVYNGALTCTLLKYELY